MNQHLQYWIEQTDCNCVAERLTGRCLKCDLKTVQQKMQGIRNAIYAINAQDVSLNMIGLKKRDDEVVYRVNENLGEVIKELDKMIDD